MIVVGRICSSGLDIVAHLFFAVDFFDTALAVKRFVLPGYFDVIAARDDF